jgi:hypothetical protein
MQFWFLNHLSYFSSSLNYVIDVHMLGYMLISQNQSLGTINFSIFFFVKYKIHMFSYILIL